MTTSGEPLAQIRKSTLTRQDREGLAWVASAEMQRTERARMELADGNVIVQIEERREIFTLQTDDEGAILFDVRGIKDAILAGWLLYSTHQVLLNEKLVENVLQRGGVEEPHIARITGEHLERPGVMLYWPDRGQHTLIDGNHRLVARWRAGRKTFKFVMVSVQPKLMPYMAAPGDEAKFFPDHLDDDAYTTIAKTIVKV